MLSCYVNCFLQSCWRSSFLCFTFTNLDFCCWSPSCCCWEFLLRGFCFLKWKFGSRSFWGCAVPADFWNETELDVRIHSQYVLQARAWISFASTKAGFSCNLTNVNAVSNSWVADCRIQHCEFEFAFCPLNGRVVVCRHPTELVE